MPHEKRRKGCACVTPWRSGDVAPRRERPCLPRQCLARPLRPRKASSYNRALHAERALPMLTLPTFDDVIAAAQRIDGHAHRTPVMHSRTVDAELGAEVFFKCENLQRMGAFKFRGAFNALSKFGPQQRQAGVVAFSSGNHAQAIALSAKLLGMPATIVMPHDAPAGKVAATRGYAGNVVVYDRYKE